MNVNGSPPVEDASAEAAWAGGGGGGGNGSSAGGGVVNMLATQDSDSDTSYDDDPESMAEIAAMGAALLRLEITVTAEELKQAQKSPRRGWWPHAL